MPEELSPAEEARLRRLLARSRHDETLPDDVAARLDDVLARMEAGDLDVEMAGDGPTEETSAAGVPSLAARRRSRVLTLLVAAAAVVVAGIGVGQVVDRSGAGGGDAMSASARDESAATLADPSEGRASDEDLEQLESETYAEDFAADGGADASTDSLDAMTLLGPSDLVVVAGRLVQVRERDFTEVAARVQRRLAPGPRTTARASAPLALHDADPRVQRAWQGCAPPEPGPGTPVAVLYDGSPAVLVLRPPEGETQVAALLQCDTGEVLRSATLLVD